jgi:hypothetical protein
VSDEFIVPVCRVHHRELHRSGNEAAWWRKLNIDPIPIALGLWAQTRTDGDALYGVDQGVNHVAAHTASTAYDQDHHAVRPLKATSAAGSDGVKAESLNALSAVPTVGVIEPAKTDRLCTRVNLVPSGITTIGTGEERFTGGETAGQFKDGKIQSVTDVAPQVEHRPKQQ